MNCRYDNAVWSRPLDLPLNNFVRLTNELASRQLKLLLEQKHLYQRVSFRPENLAEEIEKELPLSDECELKLAFESVAESLSVRPFALFNPRSPLSTPAPDDICSPPSGSDEPSRIEVDNVKLFCTSCKGREAFAPLWIGEMKDLAGDESPSHKLYIAPRWAPPTVQLFSFLYQCQCCLGEPNAFLVRRENWTLSLHGRSPMEQVEVEKFIPNIEGQYFADAVIAMNAGKTLAALFYLRTFIEQFARRQTGNQSRRATGDEIMDAYNDTLPEPQRGQMPSLKHWYSRISGALHEARGDDALFEEAREKIEHHFDIRRVFKIPDAPVIG